MMDDRKVLFVDMGEFGGLLGHHAPNQIDYFWQDHGVGLLRTILHKAGVQTDIVSTRLCSNWGELWPQLLGYDTIIMNVRSYRFGPAKLVARAFKDMNPGGIVLVGGMHASVAPEDMEAVGEFDHICKGPGEKVIVDLVKSPGDFPKMFEGPASLRMEDWPRMDRRLWPRPLPPSGQAKTWPLEDTCSWGPPPVATMITSRVCPWRCTFSVTGDTRVPVQGEGLVRCDDLKAYAEEQLAVAVGDPQVITVWPMRKTLATDIGPAASSYWVDEGLMPVLKMTLRNGLAVTATPNHQFRIVRSGEYVWSELQNIKAGDWVPIQHSTEAWGDYHALKSTYSYSHGGGIRNNRWTRDQSLEVKLDEDFAWLVGLFVGDGAFHHHGGSVDWCTLPDITARVQDLAERYLGKRGGVHTPKQSDKVRIVQVSGRVVYNLFAESLGLGPKKLKVPEAIFTGPRAVAEAFIAGLFEADGHAPNDGSAPYITTISEELAQGLALLLLNMGKHPSVMKIKRSERSKMRSPYYYRVAMDQPRDHVPIGRSAYFNKYRGERYVGLRSNLKTAGSSGVSRAILREIEPDHDLLSRAQWFSQVASIEPAGTQRVYDITIPGTATFIANGLVAHNCNEASYIPSMERRSVDSIIDELNWLDAEHGPLGSVVFHDSMFFQQPQWLREFIRKYPAKARKPWPYWAAGRADTVRKWPDLFEAMVRETNWTTVSIGFESGSDKVLEILNKECSAADNAFAIDLLNDIGDDLESKGRERPRFWANIMFAVPGESREDAFRTMKMWRRMKNPIPTLAYYAPYAGSALGYQLMAEGKSLMEKDDHQRYAGQPKVKGVDYRFYDDLLRGRYEREIQATTFP